ncbi:hypothetical protein NC651_031329 [Populus alba x Populus x berolinensis]|nr:hypothetical protein NC651_031329 [Populus alba x Populus x berolinensis]
MQFPVERVGLFSIFENENADSKREEEAPRTVEVRPWYLGMNVLWGKDTTRLLDRFQPQKEINSWEIIWCRQFHHPWNMGAS